MPRTSPVTLGFDGLNVHDLRDNPEIELVEDDGVGVRLPEDVYRELIRTPPYGGWQGESGLFHCNRAMVYLGDWDGQGNQPGQEFAEMVGVSVETVASWFRRPVDEIDDFIRENADRRFSVYRFRCDECGKHRAHWDSD